MHIPHDRTRFGLDRRQDTPKDIGAAGAILAIPRRLVTGAHDDIAQPIAIHVRNPADRPTKSPGHLIIR